MKQNSELERENKELIQANLFLRKQLVILKNMLSKELGVQECDATGLNQGTEPLANNNFESFKEDLEKEAEAFALGRGQFKTGANWTYERFVTPLLSKLDLQAKEIERLKEENEKLNKEKFQAYSMRKP